MQEVWRPVPGLEGRYEVSSLGRVRSLDMVVANSPKGRHLKKGRILKPTRAGQRGYFAVAMTKHHRRYIHHLVAEAFHGPRPEGMQCCHNNGDHEDNRPENLRWDTPKANMQDMKRHGRTLWGERNPRAKLTAADAIAIRMSPLGRRELAERYGVSVALVLKIKRGILWAHVDDTTAAAQTLGTS